MNDHNHIQELAYQIWEAEGRPNGQAAKHWNQANILANGVNDGDKKKADSSPSESEKHIERQQPDQT